MQFVSHGCVGPKLETSTEKAKNQEELPDILNGRLLSGEGEVQFWEEDRKGGSKKVELRAQECEMRCITDRVSQRSLQCTIRMQSLDERNLRRGKQTQILLLAHENFADTIGSCSSSSAAINFWQFPSSNQIQICWE